MKAGPGLADEPSSGTTSPAPDGTWSPPDLAGRVALVTGSTRGVGRGVALALGDAGATVYVTGRSTRDGATTEGLPGTVEDTAEEVERRGGVAVPVRCDHTDDAAVDALLEQVRGRHGRLDLLVNSAWAGYERAHEVRFDAPFWEQPRWRYDLFAGSVRAAFTTAQAAAPLLIGAGGGLVVNLSFTDGDTYLGQAAYDTFKHATNRLTVGMAHELRRHGVAVVALHPGFVRTERVEVAWSLIGGGPAQALHSSEYVGRAVAFLHHDPELLERSGQVVAVGALAARYGFVDVDGRQPPPFRVEGRMSLATRMERLTRIVARMNRKAP